MHAQGTWVAKWWTEAPDAGHAMRQHHQHQQHHHQRWLSPHQQRRALCNHMRVAAPLRATPPEAPAYAVQQQQHQQQQQHPRDEPLEPQSPSAPSGRSRARPWLPLNAPVVWEGTEAQALNDDASCFKGLSPTWKVMLLSDGSVTRHLQLMTGAAVKVDCLEMLNIGESTEGLPSAAALISGGARVQRTVLLRGPPPLGGSPSLPGAHTAEQNGTAASANGGGGGAPTLSPPAPVASSQQGPPLVYAVSWWRAQEVDVYLSDRSKPIWVSLSQGHVELYREVQLVHHGHNAELEQLLGCPGPFWGRQYLFWHEGRPLTLIYEVFSPLLERYLGPVLPCLPDE